MLATKEQRKEKAIEIMKQLDIYAPYMDDFGKKDEACLFENFAGFWIFQYPELNAKLQELENKYNCTVYAITHEFTSIGELYNFLIVPKHKEDWKYLICRNKNEHTVYAYVWNKTDEWCSEFGEISVKSFGGGIRREA